MKRNHSQTILAVLPILAMALALAPGAWAATETVLYSFKDLADGAGVDAPVLSLNGRLYGTTRSGGKYNLGTVFELTQTKSGWMKTTLHDFTGLDDGDEPWAGLVADKAGNLYGASLNGIQYEDGMIFELSRRGKGWKFTVIHTFSGPDGAGPSGTLIFDDAGNLYGTTGDGGRYKCGNSTCGTVFEMSPSGRGWNLTVLHDFDGGDGSYPASPLYRDSKGILYGTTESGGGNGPCNTGGGCGTIFELSPSKVGWKFTVLHTFNGTDGEFPVGALTMDKSGSLYGTTTDGGGAGYGVVYRLTLSDGKWRGTVLHDFENGSDGDDPCGALAFDSKGNLYGTTFLGGSDGVGTIFELARSGRGWQESVPFSFDGLDGMYAGAGLISGGTRRLFGTTQLGGNGDCGGSSCGVVFEFTP